MPIRFNVNYTEQQANEWQRWLGTKVDFSKCTAQEVMTVVSKKMMQLDGKDIAALSAAEDEVLKAIIGRGR